MCSGEEEGNVVQATLGGGAHPLDGEVRRWRTPAEDGKVAPAEAMCR